MTAEHTCGPVDQAHIEKIKAETRTLNAQAALMELQVHKESISSVEGYMDYFNSQSITWQQAVKVKLLSASLL